MIKNIVAKLKGIYIGWDYDKYWDCREALFYPKTCRLKFLYCKHYVSITNRRQNADIAYCIEAGNNFKGRPILGHNLNGIVIAAGAIIGSGGSSPPTSPPPPPPAPEQRQESLPGIKDDYERMDQANRRNKLTLDRPRHPDQPGLRGPSRPKP